MDKLQSGELHKSLVMNFNNAMVRVLYTNFLMWLPGDELRKQIHKNIVDTVRKGIVEIWASPDAGKKIKEQHLGFLFEMLGTDIEKEQERVIDQTDKFIIDHIDPILNTVLEDPNRQM